jgi:hypothetical protein
MMIPETIAFHFILSYQTVNFCILVVPFNKALFFGGLFCCTFWIFYSIYSTYLLHNSHWHDNNKLHDEKTPQPTKGQRYDRLTEENISNIAEGTNSLG